MKKIDPIDFTREVLIGRCLHIGKKKGINVKEISFCDMSLKELKNWIKKNE